MSVYLNHLNVGCYGDNAIKEPSEKNMKIYEAFIKEKENLKEFNDDCDFANFGSFNADLAFHKVKFSL